jgi:hypothetical protein
LSKSIPKSIFKLLKQLYQKTQLLLKLKKNKPQLLQLLKQKKHQPLMLQLKQVNKALKLMPLLLLLSNN